MILSAPLLDILDRCPRRFAFEREYEVRTISPLGLLWSSVEASMTAEDPVEGARESILRITTEKDVACGELSPLSVVRHVTAMAEVVSLALRTRLGLAQIVDRVPLLSHEWQSGTFECRGELHRIVLASHLDDDSLRSFAHAWGTVGELASLERPLTLTVVVIGSQRDGRRHGHWSKCFQHPVQKSALRFAARNKDDGFTKGWKQVWREQTDITPEMWLERMRSDDVLDDLIVSRRVQYNGKDERMIQARRDIVTLAELMGKASVDDPMRRSSCDEIGRGACPWQPVCYSPTPAGPEDLPGLYRARE